MKKLKKYRKQSKINFYQLSELQADNIILATKKKAGIPVENL